MGLFSKEPTRKEIMQESQIDKLKGEVSRCWETIWQFGVRIGKLEHQRNEARRKRGIYKRHLRNLRTLYDGLTSENTQLRVERAAMKAKLIAFERAQAAAFIEKKEAS